MFHFNNFKYAYQLFKEHYEKQKIIILNFGGLEKEFTYSDFIKLFKERKKEPKSKDIKAYNYFNNKIGYCDFWNKKFETNKKRDNFVKEELGKQNIKCLIIWECTIKNMKKDPEFKIRILKEIQNFIKNNSVNFMEL